MITIFSATNRDDSNTKLVSVNYKKIAENQGVDSQIYSFQSLPTDFGLPVDYGTIPESFKQIYEEFIAPVERFIFVLPEYNGSYPGIAKVFLDTLPPSIWEGKKAALVGVATGRAGNLRGMDHFAAVLNYLKVEVYSKKIPLSSIHKSVDEKGNIASQEYIELLENQLSTFLSF
jgi:NAD(P)H-dependent FMN reductase